MLPTTSYLTHFKLSLGFIFSIHLLRVGKSEIFMVLLGESSSCAVARRRDLDENRKFFTFSMARVIFAGVFLRLKKAQEGINIIN